MTQLQPMKSSAVSRNGQLGTRPATDSTRPLWFAAHHWIGLPVWTLLFFVCLTGTICSLSYEIAWLADSRFRSPNPDDRPAIGFQAAAEAVKAAHPDGIVTSVGERSPYLAMFVGVALPHAENATALVNRYTGEVNGIIEGPTFPAFMRELHGWLLLPWTDGTSLGYYLVGALSIFLMGSFVTGLVVYKKFWRAYLNPRLRVGQGARIFFGDLHRLIAIWSIWFIPIMALTAFWFFVSGFLFDFGAGPGKPAPYIAQAEMPKAASAADVPRIGFDEAVAVARRALPDLTVHHLARSEANYGPITVYGTDWFPLLSEYSSAVYVNPYSGAVMGSNTLQDYSALEWVEKVADPLHYGDFVGLWSKTVWFVFGLGLTTMVLSGLIVWLKRTGSVTAELVRGKASGRAVLAE